MKFARILCLVLVLALSVSLFTACGNSSSSKEPTVNADEYAEQVVSKTDVSYFDADGESKYRIVRPAEGSTGTTDSGKAIVQAVKKVCGVSIRSVTDEEDGTDAAEIIIGNTTREASAKAKKLFEMLGTGRSNEFLICTIDDDIIIYANYDETLLVATQYFCDNFIKTETISGGIYYMYIYTEGYADMSIFGLNNLSKIELVRPIYNVSWLTQSETDKLIDCISEKTGFILELKNDQIASTNYLQRPDAVSDGTGTLAQSTPAEYEIIIGDCARDGVKLSFANDDDFEIRIEDKKIYLNGKTPYSTAMAVSEFTKLIQNNNTITKEMSVTSGDYKQVINSYDNATYYRPVWYDEFEGTEINENLWNIHWDEPCYSKNTTTNKMGYRGNSQLKNNYVKDGCLYFDAIETDTSYYGGKLTTNNMMDYLYGYIEISNIHPLGVGFWVALYPITGETAPDDYLYYSEIDVDECYGHTGNWVYMNTFATPSTYGREILQLPDNIIGILQKLNRYYTKDDRGTWMDFHTYGANWIDKETVVFTVDGYPQFTNNLDQQGEHIAYSLPCELYLCMSVGSEQHGAEPTGSKAWTVSNSYVVDYVYIYQLKGHEMYINEGGNYKNNVNNWKKIVQ